MAMAHLAFTQQQHTVVARELGHRRPSTIIRCSEGSGRFASSPKTGTVGAQRLKEGALPGTYWSSNTKLGDEISVEFNKGSETVSAVARVGENLLKVAERCKVMLPTSAFCFEGSCYHCEMEVVGGASEVGPSGSGRVDELVRSCICPVPSKKGGIEVNVVSDDDVWGERVL
ncbi:hypothetical protein L7F22_030075 [Adiantum nelumboides]|nr:hypothetical protein [Adiantum nelumboides]